MATGTERRRRAIEEIEPFEAARGDRGRRRRPDRHARAARVPGGPPRGRQAGAARACSRDEIAEAAPDKSAAHDPLLPLRQPLRASPPRSCRRSATTNVASMAGGILAWQEQGLPVVATAGMTAEQRERYSRHTLLPEVGVDGQLKLLNAKVLLLGAGGLGAPTALYLAAAGIGTHRPRRRRRRRRLQPAAPGDPQHRADRDAEDRIGADLHRSAQPRRQGGRAPHPPRRRQHPRRSSRTTTSSSTAPTTSPPATCSTTPRCGCASRSSPPRSSASTARSRPSSPSRAPATAASTRPRRRPRWRRAAPPTACSA